MKRYLVGILGFTLLFACGRAMAFSITPSNDNGGLILQSSGITQGQIMSANGSNFLSNNDDDGTIFTKEKLAQFIENLKKAGVPDDLIPGIVGSLPNPEPATCLLLAFGLGGAAFLRKKFKKKI